MPHVAISPSTRSGCVAASRIAGEEASEFPITTARFEPAASSTARKSSARCCTVGMPTTGSDSPVPGLSNNRRRPIDASSRKKAVAYGSAHNRSRCEISPAPKMMSTGPSPIA
jgi:hypothetical protein